MRILVSAAGAIFCFGLRPSGPPGATPRSLSYRTLIFFDLFSMAVSMSQIYQGAQVAQWLFAIIFANYPAMAQ